jgi:Flp pilus assembly protein TadG
MAQAFRQRRRRSARAGVTSIEFAAIALAFITFAVVIVEVGQQLLVEAALEYSARAAARFGVTGAAYPSSLATNPPATRELAIAAVVVQASGNFLQAARLSVTLASYPQFGSTTPPVAGAGGPSNAVEYDVTYAQPLLTSLAADIIGRPVITHSVVLWVENEPYPGS